MRTKIAVSIISAFIVFLWFLYSGNKPKDTSQHFDFGRRSPFAVGPKDTSKSLRDVAEIVFTKLESICSKYKEDETIDPNAIENQLYQAIIPENFNVFISNHSVDMWKRCFAKVEVGENSNHRVNIYWLYANHSEILPEKRINLACDSEIHRDEDLQKEQDFAIEIFQAITDECETTENQEEKIAAKIKSRTDLDYVIDFYQVLPKFGACGGVVNIRNQETDKVIRYASYSIEGIKKFGHNCQYIKPHPADPGVIYEALRSE